MCFGSAYFRVGRVLSNVRKYYFQYLYGTFFFRTFFFYTNHTQEGSQAG